MVIFLTIFKWNIYWDILSISKPSSPSHNHISPTHVDVRYLFRVTGGFGARKFNHVVTRKSPPRPLSIVDRRWWECCSEWCSFTVYQLISKTIWRRNRSSGASYTETETCLYVKQTIGNPGGLVETRTIAKPDEVRMGMGGLWTGVCDMFNIPKGEWTIRYQWSWAIPTKIHFYSCSTSK